MPSLLLTIKAKPAARHTTPPRFVAIGENEQALEISVNAPAADGKANKAILARLADLLEIPVSHLTLKSGASAKIKRIAITDPPSDFAARLQKITQPS